MKKVNGPRVSCIIPAFNEGKRISNVLKAVAGHPLLKEVIVVSDGSTDNTVDVVKKFKGIKLIATNHNRGKSFSVYEGVKKSRGEYLFFLDADLLGLTKKNITDLILPVEKGSADITLSLRGHSGFLWNLLGLDFLSGERVFPRDLFDPKELLKLRGFALEVFMNENIIRQGLHVKVVKMYNVLNPFPTKKVGFFKGIFRFLDMLKQIFKTVGFFGAIKQIFQIHKLKV